MSESNDKELHDLVRQQLVEYQMPYFPEEWKTMRMKLKRRRRWRVLLWLTALVGIGGMAGNYWFSGNDSLIETNAVSAKDQRTESIPRFQNKGVTPTHTVALVPTQKSHRSRYTVPTTMAQVLALLIDQEGSVVEHQPEGRSMVHVEMLSGKTVIQPALRALNPQISTASPHLREIKEQLLTGNCGTDSTSYQVLARNIHRWNHSVLVCDFTSSMYPYSTQLFAWFRQHARHPSVKGMVFFTDCDSLGHETKTDGPNGKMYVSREFSAERILPLLLEAAGNTVNNKDIAENDIEALISAQQQFPDAKQLVLIADNSSPVKDMHRLHEVKKPVRVVICGSTRDTAQAFQPDFYTIAQHTKGSLHTLEDDFAPQSVAHRTWIKVGPRYYWYNARRGKFVVSRFRERPTQVLGLFWF